MRLRHLSALLLASLLAACAGHADKYPYPPHFVGPDEVNIAQVLPAPAKPGSAAYQQQLAGVLARQKALTPEDIKAIQSETHIEPQMLVLPVLGKEFTPERLPRLYQLLRYSASDAWRVSDAVEDHWNETRPWLADKRVKRYVEPITRPGYPSGHTTTNTLWALVLADMYPQYKDALLERASQIGYHRVAGGAHFPQDVEQGKRLAQVLYKYLQADAGFAHERDEAQLELNAFVDELKAEGKLANGTLGTCHDSSKRPAAPKHAQH